ncbi:hypothetical protein PG987_012012 [Apiospora arundinis]
MPFINNYHSYYPKSAPEEDSNGRIVLYTIMVRYMTDLEHRYPDSYEEWAKNRGETVFPPKPLMIIPSPCEALFMELHCYTPFSKCRDNRPDLIRHFLWSTNRNRDAAAHSSSCIFQDGFEIKTCANRYEDAGLAPAYLSRPGNCGTPY